MLTEQEIQDLEREAVEDLAATALRHVKRLPPSSRWRDPLIQVADLGSVFRLQAVPELRDLGDDMPVSMP